MLWGAYNGLILTLDRLFLREAFKRCGAVLSTAMTLLVVMIGWVLFRTDTPAHLVGFLSALSGIHGTTAAIEVPAEMPFTLLLGGLISLMPATPLYPRLVRAHEKHRWLRRGIVAALLVIYVVSIARAVTVPFQPFIYFRF